VRQITICKDKARAGAVAAEQAARLLRTAISQAGKAVFIAATGASQFDFLEVLTREKGIDWSKTTMFHLDEYVGLYPNHPASFRHYLQERLIDKVHPGRIHLIKGDASNPQEECLRLGRLISSIEVDVAFVGIGENGHLAFNDPPADLSTEDPYLIVELDKRCRGQQVGEGWFSSIEEVPKRAISMSIRQIMKAKNVICTVPEARKTEAVAQCLEGEISLIWPASILRRHRNVYYYLDEESASSLVSERAAVRSSQRMERE